MATMTIWVEEIDWKSAVGDQDPVIRDVETVEFKNDAWEIALDEGYKWIKQNYNPKYVYHTELN